MNKPSETRIVSPTGGAKGAKDIRLGGADALALLELGRIYGMGEKKYDRFNYLKGYAWSLSIDAMLRHLLAFMGGEEFDECSIHPGQHGDDHAYDATVCDGSGLLHTAHVAWHGLTLTSFQQRGVGDDDRYQPAEPVTDPNILSHQQVRDWVVLENLKATMRQLGLPVPMESRKFVGYGRTGDRSTRSRNENRVYADQPEHPCCGSSEHTLDCPRYR